MHCPEGPAELINGAGEARKAGGPGRPGRFFPQPPSPFLTDKMAKLSQTLLLSHYLPGLLWRLGELSLSSLFWELIVKLSHKCLVAHPSYLLGPSNAIFCRYSRTWGSGEARGLFPLPLLQFWQTEWQNWAETFLIRDHIYLAHPTALFSSDPVVRRVPGMVIYPTVATWPKIWLLLLASPGFWSFRRPWRVPISHTILQQYWSALWPLSRELNLIRLIKSD